MEMSGVIILYILGAAAALEVACASPDADSETQADCDGAVALDYNLNLAIASVFILWVISFFGAAFPALLALKRHPYLEYAIKFGAFAGSGVLLSTGFMHMLLSANTNLSSPCLSEGWLNAYPSWGTLFAVCTIVMMQTLDYLLFNLLGKPQSSTENPIVVESPSSSVEMVPPFADSETGECHKHMECKDEECKGRALLPTPVSTKAISNLIVSEISIGMHSIIIGLALGVTSSSDFTALFVAIIFHQVRRSLVRPLDSCSDQFIYQSFDTLHLCMHH